MISTSADFPKYGVPLKHLYIGLLFRTTPCWCGPLPFSGPFLARVFHLCQDDGLSSSVFYQEGKTSKYFLRLGNNTQELDAKETQSHISSRDRVWGHANLKQKQLQVLKNNPINTMRSPPSQQTEKPNCGYAVMVWPYPLLVPGNDAD
jgi:hypothetical protein